MPDLLAGSIVRAVDNPPAQTDVQGTTVTTTSATFVTSGADCAVSFTAPTTGRVKLMATARMISSAAAGGALLGVETREGATVGSGTVVEAASAANGPSNYGTTFARSTGTHLLTGLTPGSVYNARLLMASTSGTASFANRELIVEGAS